mmetsp:Transcript_7180/g.14577  ORF Transcript_7180/g.14577 Transcript_7180/m.14577 type:complete len:462 (-) Transcript_7180:198-1583(-)|eukprot:CAMPEP_0118939586 /NCGR_PEP_ID=MMETSP1169-20130426/29284_1 /TAXON_ID=36882 /ORGANISM="Pyramimonas obovata, Strain CCMP722" /LENGTH=461 /DNA_ID=CAMNT_0006883889 /DNA_START=226 /DNA_END=1611 /DNA_ORIENTATION=+
MGPDGEQFLTLDGKDAGRWHPDGTGYGTHIQMAFVPEHLQRDGETSRGEGIATTSGRTDSERTATGLKHRSAWDQLYFEIRYRNEIDKQRKLLSEIKHTRQILSEVNCNGSRCSPSEARSDGAVVANGERDIEHLCKLYRRQHRKVMWLKLKALTGSPLYHNNWQSDSLIFLHSHQWIEATDPKHRYGGNLMHYYMGWLRSTTELGFFDWLDCGEAMELDLPECSRAQLEATRVKYCAFFERARLEVVVRDGLLVFKESGEVVHHPLHSKEKLIFVMSMTHVLYVAQKVRGRFHHSSFLAGAPALAAGAMKVQHGVLQTIVPHSGHYRPTEADFMHFVRLLGRMGVPMAGVKLVPFKNYARKDGARALAIEHVINTSVLSGDASAKERAHLSKWEYDGDTPVGLSCSDSLLTLPAEEKLATVVQEKAVGVDVSEQEGSEESDTDEVHETEDQGRNNDSLPL